MPNFPSMNMKPWNRLSILKETKNLELKGKNSLDFPYWKFRKTDLAASKWDSRLMLQVINREVSRYLESWRRNMLLVTVSCVGGFAYLLGPSVMLVKKRKLVPHKPHSRSKYSKKKPSNSIGKKGKVVTKDKVALIHQRMKI